MESICRRCGAFALLTIVLLCLTAPVVYGGSIYLSATRGDDSNGCGLTEAAPCKSLYQALSLVNASAAIGDNVVWIEAGTYTGRSNMDIDFKNVHGALAVNASFSVALFPWTKSFSKPPTTLASGDVLFDGSLGGPSPLFQISSSPTVILLLSQMHFVRWIGSETELSGVVRMEGNSSRLNVVECVFSENSGANGAVIHATDAILSITNSTFTNNTAINGPVYISGTYAYATVSNCQFLYNSAERSGGAFVAENRSHISIDNTVFSYNNAKWDGGAILIDSLATIFIENSTLSWNKAQTDGGALHLNRGYVKLTGVTLHANSAQNGGAISIKDPGASMATYKGTVFHHNVASGNGGAIYCENAKFHLFDQTVLEYNAAINSGGGAAMVSFCFASLNETRITNNSAYYGGGWSLLYNNEARFFYSTISHNKAQFEGAGVWCTSSSVNITHTDIENNVITKDNSTAPKTEDFYCAKKRNGCDVRIMTNTTSGAFHAQCSLPKAPDSALSSLTSWQRALIIGGAGVLVMGVIILGTLVYIFARRQKRTKEFYDVMREIEMESTVGDKNNNARQNQRKPGRIQMEAEEDGHEFDEFVPTRVVRGQRSTKPAVAQPEQLVDDVEEAGGAIWLSRQLLGDDEADNDADDEASRPASFLRNKNNKTGSWDLNI